MSINYKIWMEADLFSIVSFCMKIGHDAVLSEDWRLSSSISEA